ncbi:MAG TPA: CpaD family pilus assembly protein [Sphingomicrobium sp.]|nr:CpaD family pilus assembly protein [Sphingomicrobium sp.]
MRCKLGLVLLATTLAGCSHVPYDEPSRGMSAVNVPVLTRSEYVFDAAAPDGSLPSVERARLDGWFRSLELGYGDSVYVDGPYADAARADVAQAAGRYGLLLSNGAPVTAGAVGPGMVRVVVTRTRAAVPNCPNWSEPSQPNFANHSMSNLGCAVNSNLASMVANPEDLIHGRDDSGVGDTRTSTKAVQSYRNATPTGQGGLKDISTKKKD